MNEILLRRNWHRWLSKAFIKRLLWKAATPVALGGLYAWRIEDHWIRVERRNMPIANLGGGFEGCTIAQISDLHSSPIVLDRYLTQCIEHVNRLGPDFVVITGDMILGARAHARKVSRILANLSPGIATVACLGNHDYGIFHPRGRGGLSGLADYVTQELALSNIFVLRNQRRVFHRDGSAIQFVGVEDFWSGRYDPCLAFEEAQTLPTIGLCHNPDGAWHMAYWGADWVLAGHTHGSDKTDTKIRDFFMPTAYKDFLAGEYSLGGGRYLYVNRGLSYARRMNLNARPEITLFTLRRA